MKVRDINQSRFFRHTLVIAIGAIFLLIFLLTILYFRCQQLIIKSAEALPLSNPIVISDSVPLKILQTDLNNDALPDYINSESGAFKVYLNNGAGFTLAQTISQSVLPNSELRAARVNADASPDLVLISQGQIKTFFNNGAGNFGSAHTAVIGGSIGLSVGQFDGDNLLDVVGLTASSFFILHGDGLGDFSNQSSHPGLANQKSIAAADYNADGHDDIAIVGDALQLYINTGSGNFAAGVNYQTSGIKMITTDLNNDNLPDLAFINNKLIVYVNKGDASFVLLGIYDGSATIWQQGTAVFSCDYNQDGLWDIGAVFGSRKIYQNQNHPFITYLAPGAVFVGATNFTLKVYGSGFAVNSVVRLNGTAKATTYISSTELRAQILSSDASSVSSNDITVYNPDQNIESIVSFFYVEPGFFDPQTVTVATQPKAGFSADFNNDTILDLAVANSGSNNVSIQLGNGDGLFHAASPATVTVSTSPRSITGGDFNGDSNIDLAVANYGTNKLTILSGNGQGGFANMAEITTGTQPTKVISADINNDNVLDLITANSGSNSLSVFAGNGAGGFTSVATLTTATQPRSVAAADITGDGNIDLISANYGSNNISVFLGNGSGGFTSASPATVSVGNQPIALTLADYNSDNLSDCLVVNSGNNTVSVLLGNGAGGFTSASPATFNTDILPQAIISLDFNDDANMDLAVVNYTDNSILMVLGNGDGTFGSAINYDVGTQPVDIFNGDFNGDGSLDLITVNYGSNNVSVLFKKTVNRTNVFEDKVNYPVGSFPVGIIGGDFDGDTKKDLAVVNSGSDTVTLLKNSGSGTFSPVLEFDTSDRPTGIDTADLNKDGREDLAVVSSNSANYSVFLGKPDGTLPNAKNYSLSDWPYSFTAADFTGDQINDLAVTFSDLKVYQGNNDTTFNYLAAYPAGSWPRGIVNGDFNGDQLPDLAVVNAGSQNISVYLGFVNGDFNTAVNYAIGPNPSSGSNSLVSADLNNDSILDLAVVRFSDPNSDPDYFMCQMNGCYDPNPPEICSMLGCPAPLSGNGIYVLSGVGDGTFSPYTSYGDLINSNFLISEDLNNDNYVDLVAAKNDENKIVILLNDGTGGFNYSSEFAYLGTPEISAGKDLNNDGSVDLAVATTQEKKLHILINNGSGSFSEGQIKDINIEPSNLLIVDLDVDGNEDIIISSRYNIASVPVYLGIGDGTFNDSIDYSSAASVDKMLLFDNNGDANVDLVTLNNSKKLISTLVNNGDGTLDTPFVFPGFQGPISHILHADFNNDEILDLLVGPLVAFGDGNGRFVNDVNVVDGMSTYASISGDFNEDGNIDLASVDIGLDRIAVAIGTGTGTFGSPAYYSVGINPWDILAADFNSDGHLDLAVANTSSASISLLEGYGDGSFSASQPANVYYRVKSIINGDFNGDAKVDLAVVNDPSYLSVLLGNDNFTFQPPIDYFVGHDPQTVTADDFNNDGRMDLAVTNSQDNDISVFLGQIAAPIRYGSKYYYAPSAPSNLTCESADSHSIRWIFQYPSSLDVGFSLYDNESNLVEADYQNINEVRSLRESNLSPNTKYENRFVISYNSSGKSSPSNVASCYTMANEPLPLIINNMEGQINVSIDSNDGNPAGTDYAIYEYYSDSYLHFDGKLYKNEPQWRPYDGWKGISGIRINETLGVYDFHPLARNGAGKISGFLPQGLYLSCKALSSTEINWQLRTPSVSVQEGYAFYREQENQDPLLISDLKNSSNDVIYAEINLMPNSQYSGYFTTYKTIDGNKIESQASNTEKCFTLANEPLPIIIGEVTENSVQLILDNKDGNPEETLYAIYEAKSGKYVQADGSLGSEPFWQTYEQWGGANGIFVSVLGAQVMGQFRITLTNVDLSQYDFVAQVKNGDDIVTAEPAAVISASKGVAINLVTNSNTLLGKIASASNNFQKQSVALRLIQEFSIFLNILLLILIIFFGLNLYGAYKYLNISGKIKEKVKYLFLILKHEPAVLFSHLAGRDNNGTYKVSYHRHRQLHLNSQKGLQRTAGILVLKVVILVVLTISLAGLQYASIAQVNYTQDTEDIKVGDKLSYIIRFTNTGDSDAAAITVTDKLDPNLSFVPGSDKIVVNGVEILNGTDNSIKNEIDPLIFTVGNLGINQNASITFDALVKDTGLDREILNSAEIAGLNFDTQTTNIVRNKVITEQVLVEEKPTEELTETQVEVPAQPEVPVSSGGSTNLLPLAVDDSAQTSINQAVEIAVLVNDSDPENQLDPVTFVLVSQPKNGTASIDPNNLSIIYMPSADYVGEDIINYRICDSVGQCAEAKVLVTINPVEVAGGEEVNVSFFGSLLNALTEDVSKTNIGEQALAGLTQNETVQNIINSKPVQFAQDKVLNNPVVEQVSQDVVTPTLVTISVINTAPAIATAGLNFGGFLHFIFVEPLLILFRKKRKNWGVVYDSLTKMPISLALVRLYRKEDRRLVQTKVTDRDGRYLIMVKDPGVYYLEVTKLNYDYPTKILGTEKTDTKYLDLYHGEELTIQDKDAAVSVNIPLDVRDKKVKPITAVLRSFALQHLKNVISYVGLILAVLVLIIYPSIITIAALIFHVIFYVTFRKLLMPAKPKGWGIVYDEKTKQNLNNVVVRLFDMKFNKLLETQLTDSKGRYAFLVGKNVYQILAEKEGYQAKEIKPVDLTTNEELVNLDIALAKPFEPVIIKTNNEQPNQNQSTI